MSNRRVVRARGSGWGGVLHPPHLVGDVGEELHEALQQVLHLLLTQALAARAQDAVTEDADHLCVRVLAIHVLQSIQAVQVGVGGQRRGRLLGATKRYMAGAATAPC